MGTAAQLNVSNIDHMIAQPPRRFEWLRFDSTNDCNLHCVYCHNRRSQELIDLDKLDRFLSNCVEQIDNFQFGCVMEPTLDKRMADIMQLVADSRARPNDQFMLQTNGVLLHLHDHKKIEDAGLTHLSVSIDSNNPETFKRLRGGASFNKVARNTEKFRELCPEVIVQFITTVNTANIDEIDDLVGWGVELGVRRYILREMFFDPQSNIVNHDDMRQLLLPPGEFAKMQNAIQEKYSEQASFFFSESERLVDYAEDVRAASYPTDDDPPQSELVQVRT